MIWNPMEWRAEIWATVIAAIALIRPEIQAFFSRRKNKVFLELRRHVEVGFGPFGPTLGIIGSFVAFGLPRVYPRMRIKLTRKRDSATHFFEAFIERPQNPFLSSGEMAQQARLFQPIRVSDGFAQSINLMFNDPATLEEITREAEIFSQRWQDYQDQHNAQEFTFFSQEIQDLFRVFIDERGLVPFIVAQERSFYWVAGTYQAEFILEDTRGRSKVIQNIDFHLSEENAEFLKKNFLANGILAAKNVLLNPQFFHAQARVLSSTVHDGKRSSRDAA